MLSSSSNFEKFMRFQETLWHFFTFLIEWAAICLRVLNKPRAFGWLENQVFSQFFNFQDVVVEWPIRWGKCQIILGINATHVQQKWYVCQV